MYLNITGITKITPKVTRLPPEIPDSKIPKPNDIHAPFSSK